MDISTPMTMFKINEYSVDDFLCVSLGRKRSDADHNNLVYGWNPRTGETMSSDTQHYNHMNYYKLSRSEIRQLSRHLLHVLDKKELKRRAR